MNTTPGAPSRLRVPTALVLGLALALAAVLRVRESLRTPLWFDEIYIVAVARQGLLDVVRTVARDIHPPLQFLLRWAWIRIGGEGEQWVRSLSILLALLSLVWTWRLGRRLFGRFPALFAVALLAIHPTHIRYSQEVEDYSLTWLLLLAATESAWNWIERRRLEDAFGYWIWGALALYAHYLSLFYLATLFVAELALQARRPGRPGAWLGIHAALGLAFLPQALVFVNQFQREGSGAFFHFPTLAAVAELWRHMAFGATYLIVPLLALSLVPLFLPGQRRAALLLWTLCVLPLLSPRLWVIILPREVLYILPLWLLLVGAGLARLPGRWTAPALAILLFAFGARAWSRHGPFTEAVSLQRAERFVQVHGTPQDLVLHAESHSLLFFLYHDPGARNRLLLPRGERVPYFEGGLAIPESVYYSPEDWARDRAAGARWWGVRVDRAYVTRGRVSRAGERGAAMLQAASDSSWSWPPVTLYRGR